MARLTKPLEPTEQYVTEANPTAAPTHTRADAHPNTTHYPAFNASSACALARSLPINEMNASISSTAVLSSCCKEEAVHFS